MCFLNCKIWDSNLRPNDAFVTNGFAITLPSRTIEWQTTDAGGEFLSIDWEKKNPSDN